jgi:hypothetical protein
MHEVGRGGGCGEGETEGMGGEPRERVLNKEPSSLIIYSIIHPHDMKCKVQTHPGVLGYA